MYFVGIDLGSSSVKLSVFDADKEQEICAVTTPDFEMPIEALKFGWAEQNPEKWWQYVQDGFLKLKSKSIDLKKVAAIGIAYQMHGLVITDENLKPVRPSIIWCDSRAVEEGQKIYQAIGAQKCQNQILGSPGNFTASKLKWVKEHEPEIFEKVKYMMLPGDYIAAKLSRKAQTSTSGLSEAALWDFTNQKLAKDILDHMNISDEVIPEVVPNFGIQAQIHPEVASELGLNLGVKITYRAGDQPNNALSLNVLNPGEIATTAGTSAVIYAVSDQDTYDANNRINTFLHVNNSAVNKRNGMMVCINGSGILYQWLRKLLSFDNLLDYDLLNKEAAKTEPGCKGLLFHPFGNGVERIFNNQSATSGISNLNFNIHDRSHMVRAACEGIIFAMNYGFDVMKSLGVNGKVVRAGKSNLFLNPIFRAIFANTTNTELELYNTSGAEGAARGAAYGYGYFTDLKESFKSLKCIEHVEPSKELVVKYFDIYQNWKEQININA